MFASFDGKGRLFVFESDGSSPSTEDMLKNLPICFGCWKTRMETEFSTQAKSLQIPFLSKGGVFYQAACM